MLHRDAAWLSDWSTPDWPEPPLQLRECPLLFDPTSSFPASRSPATFRNVRSVVGPHVEVAGVVKADAYGHGALEVARVLCAEGARWLAVSSVDEGVQLRSGGIHEARILVMGGFLAYEGDAVVEFDLTPAVHSLAQIRDVDRLAAVVRQAHPLPPEDRFRHGPPGNARQRRGDPRHARRCTRTRDWKG